MARGEQAADELAAQLRAAITSMPDPHPAALFAHVYAEEHAPLAKAEHDYLQSLEGFETGEGR